MNTRADMTGMTTMRDTINRYWLIAISLLCLITVFLLDPVAQDLRYHVFADKRSLLGIPHFWNVISNLAFIISGALGLGLCFSQRRLARVEHIQIAYPLFFAGILLTGAGSAYYHLSPDNSSLSLDRLPMTLAFISVFCIVLAEHVSARAARILLWPCLLAGAASVGYWHVSETRLQGDLRAYLLVQYLPLLLIPLIMLCFRSRFTLREYYWLMFGLYLLAKLAEHFDHEIFAFSGFGGHALKHLFAGAGVLVFYFMLRNRRPVVTAQSSPSPPGGPGHSADARPVPND